VPVGIPEGDTPVTVAVNVTIALEKDGFAEEEIAVLLVPVPVIVKPVNKLDVPVGVFTENCCCPAVAVDAILIATGRLVEVPPGWIVAVKPVPVNTMDVAPVKLVPFMITLTNEPCEPDGEVMDVIVGCELMPASST
jgi:hypothetical protein